MGVLDLEYLSVLAQRHFRSKRAALAYYLDNEGDTVVALGLNPLIEKDWIAAAHPETDASWFAILWHSRELFSTGPGFDAANYSRSGGASARRPTLKAIRAFLRTATPSTPLPVAADGRGPVPSWGEFRTRALGRAAQYVHQLSVRVARTSESWDSDAEGRFLRELEGARSAGIGVKTVSIVLPTRNRVGSLHQAVESVLAQTFANWELIVVDDASTDGTAEYLATLADTDGRVHIVRGDGTGVGAARNRGLSSASGDVVAFLDSDNTWRPEFLERCLAGMDLESGDFVYCGMRVHREGGVVYRGMQGSADDLLYGGNFIDLNATMIERSLVEAAGGFDPAVKRWSDFDLFLTLIRRTPPRYLPFLGVEYDDRASAHRITHSEPPSWEDVVIGKHLIDWQDVAATARRAGCVSIIIPTYLDWRLTATAVRSVLDNSGNRELDLVILDNGSPRPVSAILDGLFGSHPTVRITRAARNLNFALGNNYALSGSVGEFVVALNNDTEVQLGWLEPLVAEVAGDARVIASQPLLLYPGGTIQTAGTVFLDDGKPPRHFLQGLSRDEASRVPSADYSAITAAAMCIRADTLIELHGFDPVFTNGLEDVDLCLRALRAHPGSVFRVVPTSVVVHHEGKTPGRSRAIERNRELFSGRWNDSMPPSDLWRYTAMGVPVPED
jgi:glycosyltransferase involved in cell wall biosynthesis